MISLKEQLTRWPVPVYRLFPLLSIYYIAKQMEWPISNWCCDNNAGLWFESKM